MASVFEEKSVSKAILRVGLPAMLGQLTTLIYNMADTFFVSLTQEPSMIAAVTLCTPILLIIMSIACVFGMGGASLIARLLGEGKKNDAGATLNFCVYAMALAGIITLALGLIFLPAFARISGADAENIGYTCDYLRYIFLGAPFIMLSNGFVHLFRSVGRIKESTVGLILGNGVNIVLDYVFILPLQWGAAGAALATSIGFVCSSVYYLLCMAREERKGNPLLPLSPRAFAPTFDMVRKVVSIGIPGALITVLMSVANIVLNNYIAIYGSNAVASYGIAYKIDMIPILLLVGLSQGVAPLIGYCYGANQARRMSETMRFSILYGILLGAAFTALFLLAGRQLSAIFLHEEALIRQAGDFLKILCLSAPMLAVINMVTSYFQALGKALYSLTITVLRNAVLFIPSVILLNRFWGLSGIIAAQPVVETLLAVLCAALYARQSRLGRSALAINTAS
ncbi:MAG TPA: MATE family efflux transporter [Candidatus Pullichristensenella excrementigallinarum]|uniref:Multidrug export protein MepA n=1 Tax=Candidatus Pullichristensenella excrementigallinarum TaxID=2840907 RepID=A0A9D1LCT4_9FIRM|nr:MATE family efflux transporter [Candidatus Pullichristensenella excrementigallinarum]